MDYKVKFKTELAQIYSDNELDVLFKMLIAAIKTKEFGDVMADGISLNTEENTIFYDAIHQLKKLKPIQHILGIADFYGLQFIVNHNVLIPRPETEELVHLIIVNHKNTAVDILDIGTGSGCIAITLKCKLPMANVSAMDLSLNALAIADKNAIKHKTAITFFKDDALKLTAKNYPQYDVIVSNPPYIAEREKTQMESLVLNHEPHLALFVPNKNALIFYEKITDFAITNLKPAGTLYFEINQNLAQETKDLIESKGFEVSLLKDLNDNFRMMKCSFKR